MPNSKLVKNLSPEEEELQRKKEELAALEGQLVYPGYRAPEGTIDPGHTGSRG